MPDGFPDQSPLASREEPLTPVETERELSRLITAITTAQLDLARFRKARAVAYLAHRKAQVRAAHSKDCPKVERGGTTVAEREAWIEQEVWDEFEAFTKAETMEAIGVENLRATLATAEVTRSLNSSVRAAYGMAGYQKEHQT